MYTIKDLYDLDHTIAKEYLEGFKYPWEALDGIEKFILQVGPTLGDDFEEVSENVWIHKTAKVYDSAFIGAPCIIGAESEVRHGAFIRSSVIVGENCVVGNSVELKNVILFDNVETPHYNYVGDSILGFHAHMGAGSITSNIKSDRTNIVVNDGTLGIQTGRKKIGAMLGDWVEVGCNSVLNPGSMIGKHCTIYPLSPVRGLIPENSIYKTSGEIVEKKLPVGLK